MLRIVDSKNRRAVQALLAPERVRDAATDRRVAAIVTGVRRGGDPALLRYARKFDGLTEPIEVTPADFDKFERLLGDIQTAYGKEDLGALRAHTTPEMLSYFSEDLARNASRGVVNQISDVKLLQGDLSEAWREFNDEYATVAMRYSLNDKMVDRVTGRVVEEEPSEATEFWTFRRAREGDWVLSAIQQT